MAEYCIQHRDWQSKRQSCARQFLICVKSPRNLHQVIVQSASDYIAICVKSQAHLTLIASCFDVK